MISSTNTIRANHAPDEWARLDRLRGLLLQRAVEAGVQLHAKDIRFARAPLRICPLGAHIDHQLGIVTGMTIDQSILMAFAPAPNGTVTLHSTGFDTPVTFDLQAPPPFQPGDWGNYARGAAVALAQRLPLTTGFIGVVDGSMPVGGLSSSAAVTIAYLLALEAIHGGVLEPRENVQLCRATENGYIGLNNGILDQSVILYNEHARLTQIDCQALEVEQIAAPEEMLDRYAIMVVYSGVAKSLAGTEYNRRVAECRDAAQALLAAARQAQTDATFLPWHVGHSIKVHLRQVAPEIFDEYGHLLPDALYRRARHFFGEMARVQAGVSAWQQGDLAAFGALMAESGASSIRWYESGSPPLITLYDTLCQAPGVYGARFSGAGFRGNCIALVDPNQQDAAAEAIHQRYPAAHPEYADMYSVHFCWPGAGAVLLDGEFLPIVS